MAIHNIRLPTEVERGAQGGPNFKTNVTELFNGFEQRNIEWAQQRCEFDVSYGIGTKQLYQQVLRFFYARRGKAFGFRFKDWADYKVERDTIGTGNGTEDKYQIVKRYSDSASTYVRNIHFPIASTVKIWVNNVLQTVTTHYTIDPLTGVVDFVTPPTNGLNIECECEFDVPVRFDTDRMRVTLEWEMAGRVDAIPLVELRQEEILA